MIERKDEKHYAPACPEPLGACPINQEGMCCFYCSNRSRCSLGPCHRLPSKCGFWKDKNKKKGKIINENYLCGTSI